MMSYDSHSKAKSSICDIASGSPGIALSQTVHVHWRVGAEQGFFFIYSL